MQLLIENNRVPRALSLKQELQDKGRTIDLPTYGSFIDYYARHGQVGSSLLLLKECISVHGSPPVEDSLKRLRMTCRQADVDNEIGLNGLIGESPTEWLRYGEKFLKREKTKKGRRQVRFAYDRALKA